MLASQLYVVPTPIGNLEDITLRAIKTLQNVDFILAEDTRTTANLLKHLNIEKALHSYHNFNEHNKTKFIVDEIQKGKIVALVSDAGTPAISDPGFFLVRECLKNNIKVECLPGATAFVPALVKSGFPTDSFVFEGFLPHKKGRQTRLKNIAEESRTVVLYESPYRLVKCLEEILLFMGEKRQVSVSRELTKLYEETMNGKVKEVLAYFKEKNIKGEIVIVIAGKDLGT